MGNGCASYPYPTTRLGSGRRGRPLVVVSHPPDMVVATEPDPDGTREEPLTWDARSHCGSAVTTAPVGPSAATAWSSSSSASATPGSCVLAATPAAPPPPATSSPTCAARSRRWQ